MIPTPEQARELVEHFGSQRPAAHAASVPRSTLRHWLNPEVSHERFRRNRAADPEGSRRRNREWYRDLSGLEYNRLRLRERRNKALRRRAERDKRRASGPV